MSFKMIVVALVVPLFPTVQTEAHVLEKSRIDFAPALLHDETEKLLVNWADH